MRREVLDALKDPTTGYYDPRDPFTAVPKALVPEQPYASFAVTDDGAPSEREAVAGHPHRRSFGSTW